ncbi:MAG: dihydrodipicolinate synthase family protein [Gemmatimonadaceae bacterium]
MTLALRGIFGPVTTPFDATGELDRAGFEGNVAAHMREGAGGWLAGVVVTGSTGEAPLLDERERDSLVEWSRPLVTGDRRLIAGIGAESTRTTLERAKRVSDRGADAALVVAPHYFGAAMSVDALRAHYQRLADESPIPLVLYNIPKYMHFRLDPALVRELARHENIIGIKDSSGDRDLLAEYVGMQSDTFAVLTGSAQLLTEALKLGARGGVLAVSLFAPALTRSVVDAAGKKTPAAEALQGRLLPLAKVIVGEMGIPAVKAALDAVGLAGGMPRLPLLPLSREGREKVRQLLRDAELSVAA